MGRHFDVVGDDGDVEGADVMGDVMGDFTSDYEGGAQVVGYTDEGYPMVVGKGRRRRGPQVQLTQPGWRRGQLAPGVIAPDQGLLPLPMGSFTYNLGNQINTFQGQLQKPFRGERLLVSVVRTGTTAVGRGGGDAASMPAERTKRARRGSRERPALLAEAQEHVAAAGGGSDWVGLPHLRRGRARPAVDRGEGAVDICGRG